MLSSQVTVRLLATTILLTGIALAGAAVAAPLPEKAAVAQGKMATVTSPTAAAVSAVPASVVAPVPAAVSEAPACARKVKMIYAGYGEAARATASCAVSKSAAAD